MGVSVGACQLHGIKTFLLFHPCLDGICLTWKLKKFKEKDFVSHCTVPVSHPWPHLTTTLTSAIVTLKRASSPPAFVEISKLPFSQIISCPCPCFPALTSVGLTWPPMHSKQLHTKMQQPIGRPLYPILGQWQATIVALKWFGKKLLPRSGQALTMLKIMEIECEEWLLGEGSSDVAWWWGAGLQSGAGRTCGHSMLIPAPNTVVATGANTVVTTGANTVVTTGANTVDNETTHTSRLEYYGQHTWQW